MANPIKSSLRKPKSNPLQCLEVEKPTDHGFFKLPRELRDRIYEQVTKDAIWREGTSTSMKIHTSRTRHMGFNYRGDRDMHALLFTSRLTHAELIEVLDRREIPHEIRIGIVAKLWPGANMFEPTIKLDTALPTEAEAAEIEIDVLHRFGRSPYDAAYSHRLVSSDTFLNFNKLLVECNFLATLSFRWKERTAYRNGSSTPDKTIRLEMQGNLRKVVETLPALRDYSIKFESSLLYATRPAVSVPRTSAEVMRLAYDRVIGPPADQSLQLSELRALVLNKQEDVRLSTIPSVHDGL